MLKSLIKTKSKIHAATKKTKETAIFKFLRKMNEIKRKSKKLTAGTKIFRKLKIPFFTIDFTQKKITPAQIKDRIANV